MTKLLDHEPLDQSATVLIIDGDQLLLVGATAVGLGSRPDLLPPEYQSSSSESSSATTRPARLPRQRFETPERSAKGVTTRLPDVAEPDQEHQRFAERRASIANDSWSRRRQRRARIVLGGLLVGCSGLLLVASPVLRVQQIELVGLNSLNREAVLKTMAIGDHPSMLGLKATDVERRLTALPLIHSATVWKEWPNRIVVEISERSAVAAIRSNGGWLVLDQHGGVLDTRTVRPDLPLLDLGGQEVKEGSKDINALLKVASAASARLRQQIDVLAVEPDEGVTVRMRSGSVSEAGTVIRIGHADDVAAKLRALATMIDDSTAVSFDGVATLDLTVADQPALLRKVVPPSLDPAGQSADQTTADQTTDAGGSAAGAPSGGDGPVTGTVPSA